MGLGKDVGSKKYRVSLSYSKQDLTAKLTAAYSRRGVLGSSDYPIMIRAARTERPTVYYGH